MRKRRPNIYVTWKEIVDEMMKAGRCSPEDGKRQQEALDFAICRDNVRQVRHEQNQGARLGQSLVFVAFFLVSLLAWHFALDIPWPTSLALAMIAGWFTYAVLTNLEKIIEKSDRLIDLTTYILAMSVSQRQSIPLYSARCLVEYMRHTDLKFEEHLLDRDVACFQYQISWPCQDGDCDKCDGRSPEPLRDKCLHSCHRNR